MHYKPSSNCQESPAKPSSLANEWPHFSKKAKLFVTVWNCLKMCVVTGVISLCAYPVGTVWNEIVRKLKCVLRVLRSVLSMFFLFLFFFSLSQSFSIFLSLQFSLCIFFLHIFSLSVLLFFLFVFFFFLSHSFTIFLSLSLSLFLSFSLSLFISTTLPLHFSLYTFSLSPDVNRKTRKTRNGCGCGCDRWRNSRWSNALVH